ncbi:MAG: YigZ family protein [Oscillospiraceae bacterium]|nr:YigZ family protein [Oscillospiraceae bacterium]
MSYKTVRNRATDSITIEKSEFIGVICPVKTDEEAVAFIESVRSEHRKARHNCYAYILRDNFISRYSDDGEPQGTAGLPILDVLKKTGLTDVCIVVTRYFGGILLGKGGLTRAYSNAASLAVIASEVVEMLSGYYLTIESDYSRYERIIRCLGEHGARVDNTEFAENVKITAAIKAEACERLMETLVDITNGGVSLCKSDETTIDFS